jgi:branched-chain amino acid transport system permease protein
MSRAEKVVAGVLALAAVLSGADAIGFGSLYTLRVLSMAGIFAILALGYRFIFGQAGALSLAQGTFMGVGAYVSGILAVRYGVAFDAALPASVAAPVLLALLVAVPVLRLETHYFALATLIVGHLALLIAVQWESVTGGANGIGGVPGLSLFGLPVRSGGPTLALVWCLVAAGGTLGWLVTRGRRGLAYALLRTHPVAAAAAAIDGSRLRLIALLLSAAYAGVAGSLYAHVLRVISPDVLGFPVMVTCLTIAVIGSRTRIAGAIAGAVLIIELPEWFRFLRDFYLLAYGAILLAVVIVMPEGVIVAAERFAARWLPAPPAQPPSPGPPPAPPRPAGGTLLEIARLSRRFGGVVALADVSFSLRPGEVVGLIGPNGSGKTTLLNAITGIFPATSGRVTFGGQDITHRLPHRIARGGIARSFQSVALLEDRTALDNVAVAIDAGDAAARAEAVTLLTMMGSEDVAMAPAGSLPFGTRRRIEIARALALRPALLLLDEPAAGLSENEQADLAACLRRLSGAGVAVLVIEHNIRFLAGLADRLICLDGGAVIAQGAAAEVLAERRVIAAYLGEATPGG